MGNEKCRGWLARPTGAYHSEREKDAIYRARLIIESLGTTQRVRMVGMPATNAFYCPYLPRNWPYGKVFRTRAILAFYLDIFEIDSDRFIRSTNPQ